jgi:hypothetical protein
LLITFFARIFPIIPIEETILEAGASTTQEPVNVTNVSLLTPKEHAIV